MRVFAFHLLNDLSGSPKVLSQVLKGLVSKGEEVHLVSSMKKEGFLTDIEGIQYIDNRYTFHQNVLLRLFKLFYVQFYTVVKLYRKINSSDIVYVNTILPFGGAILGKLKGCKVVYHLHETSMKPKILKSFLFFFVKRMATEVIYVSQYLKNQEPISVPSKVVYNSIENEYLESAVKYSKVENKRPVVLMICSLKAYKGVFEFLDLARAMEIYDFQLIVNAEQNEINSFFKESSIPKNLTVFPRQTNVAKFYAQADLLMNLSRPDEWVETFGLTVIEAMVFGVPSIVPTVGGIAELVDDGVNGFKISCYNSIELKKCLINILNHPNVRSDMSQQSLKKVKLFSEQEQINQIHSIFLS